VAGIAVLDEATKELEKIWEEKYIQNDSLSIGNQVGKPFL